MFESDRHPISDLLIALPSDDFERFPTHHRHQAAAGLLESWIGLWHPQLIQAAPTLPMVQLDSAPQLGNPNPENPHIGRPLLVIPGVGQDSAASESLMNWLAHADPIIVDAPTTRESILAAAHQALPELGEAALSFDQKVVADFYSLGYGYLLVQLLTQKLRYSTNLDASQFQTAVQTAARAAAQNDLGRYQELIFTCFDLLLEEKNTYYPVQPQLCQFILLHPNTLGISLDRQLGSLDTPASILLTGELAEKLSSQNTDAKDTIKSKLKDKSISIVGGLQSEVANELISSETWLNQLQQGRATIQNHFQAYPCVFVHRTYGLHPSVPGLLQKSGFSGVIHGNFANGAVPNLGNGIMRWNGDDDESILAVSDTPMDVADSGTFLNLSVRIGEMIDSAHSATAVLAHWPGKTCRVFDDFKHLSRFVPLLGQFVTFDHLFDEAYDPGYGQTFTCDQYRPPYLTNAVQGHPTNPISQSTDYWRRIYQIRAIRQLLLIAVLRLDLKHRISQPIIQEINRLQSAVESEMANPGDQSPLSIDAQVDAVRKTVQSLFCPDRPTGSRFHVINPHSSTLRFECRPGVLKTRTGTMRDRNIVALACNDDRHRPQWIMELPGTSVHTVDFDDVDKADYFRKDPPLCIDFQLQNEFFQLQVDQQRGGIKSIRRHLSRENLGSQQLAIRLPNRSDPSRRYTRMMAEQIERLENGPLSAAIRTSGKLMDADQVVATFQQTIRVVRGINRVEITARVDPLSALPVSKNSYACTRLAWKSAGDRLYANSMDSMSQIAGQWFQATQYVSIRGEASLTLLTGGLPFHRRASRRMLDSVLAIGNQSPQEFTFAIDLDQRYPSAAAAARLAPAVLIPSPNEKSDPAEHRYFHFNRRNVLATFSQPLFNAQGDCCGAVFRIKETESRPVDLAITCFRPLESAEQVDFQGTRISRLAIAGDPPNQAQVKLAALAYSEIRIYFKT